jgi:hypothetical protein
MSACTAATFWSLEGLAAGDGFVGQGCAQLTLDHPIANVAQALGFLHASEDGLERGVELAHLVEHRAEELLHRGVAGASLDQPEDLMAYGQGLLGLPVALVVGDGGQPGGQVGAGDG